MLYFVLNNKRWNLKIKQFFFLSLYIIFCKNNLVRYAIEVLNVYKIKKYLHKFFFITDRRIFIRLILSLILF